MRYNSTMFISFYCIKRSILREYLINEKNGTAIFGVIFFLYFGLRNLSMNILQWHCDLRIVRDNEWRIHCIPTLFQQTYSNNGRNLSRRSRCSLSEPSRYDNTYTKQNPTVWTELISLAAGIVVYITHSFASEFNVVVCIGVVKNYKHILQENINFVTCKHFSIYSLIQLTILIRIVWKVYIYFVGLHKIR